MEDTTTDFNCLKGWWLGKVELCDRLFIMDWFHENCTIRPLLYFANCSNHCTFAQSFNAGSCLKSYFKNSLCQYGQIFSHFRPHKGEGGRGSTISYSLTFEDFRLPFFYLIAFMYTGMCMMWIHCDFMDRSL